MSDPRAKLIESLTADFKRFLSASMPRIDDAMEDEDATASFSSTCQFRHKSKKKGGGLSVEFKCRERVPLEVVEHSIELDEASGQLVLI